MSTSPTDKKPSKCSNFFIHCQVHPDSVGCDELLNCLKKFISGPYEKQTGEYEGLQGYNINIKNGAYTDILTKRFAALKICKYTIVERRGTYHKAMKLEDDLEPPKRKKVKNSSSMNAEDFLLKGRHSRLEKAFFTYKASTDVVLGRSMNMFKELEKCHRKQEQESIQLNLMLEDFENRREADRIKEAKNEAARLKFEKKVKQNELKTKFEIEKLRLEQVDLKTTTNRHEYKLTTLEEKLTKMQKQLKSMDNAKKPKQGSMSHLPESKNAEEEHHNSGTFIGHSNSDSDIINSVHDARPKSARN